MWNDKVNAEFSGYRAVYVPGVSKLRIERYWPRHAGGTVELGARMKAISH